MEVSIMEERTQAELSTFGLTPPNAHQAKKRYLPQAVSHLKLADPTEESITVLVYITRPGEVVAIPMSWSPVTGKIKKMHDSSWKDLGVEKNVSRVRSSAIKLAKREHKNRVLQYATYDLFKS